jgi:hypothetical protein
MERSGKKPVCRIGQQGNEHYYKGSDTLACRQEIDYEWQQKEP